MKTATDDEIKRLAGTSAWQRGLEYYVQGRVKALEVQDGVILAGVRGSRVYQVALSAEGSAEDFSCDCPVGDSGAFCKHCVAVALSWKGREDNGVTVVRGRAKSREITLKDVAGVLRNEDKDELIRLVIGWAKEDERLHERLILFAARRSGPHAAAAAASRALESAIAVGDYVDYREAASWAHGVDKAIDAVGELLEDGHAAAAIQICESALKLLLLAIQEVDDSDGHFGSLRDRLEETHHKACQAARPDAAALARRLFAMELTSDFDVLSGAAERYAKILGAEGLDVYRQLAEAEWAKVPVRTARQPRETWGEHFRITSIMESLAKASGTLDDLIAVMSRDLSSAYLYLRIGEVCREARRYDEALRWAETGLKAFPQRTDRRLREFVAEEYQRVGRHDDAMKLVWTEFLEHLGLEPWKLLNKHAERAGTWPGWQERALAEVRSRCGRAKDRSLLVEIFLHERDPDQAWLEAQTADCSDGLWLRLATVREKEHPADSAPVYMRLAESAVAAVHNGRYEDAVGLLIKTAAVMRRLDRSPEFVAQLEALRTKYRIKRNFIKLVEQKRKALYL